MSEKEPIRVEHGQIKIEHNGYEIVWSDNQDCWSCFALDFTDKSLAKLKQRINRYDADLRRVPQVAAYQFEGSYSTTIEEVTITLIEDEKNVWVTSLDRRYKMKERRKVSLESLIPKTAEAAEAVRAWRDKIKAVREAEAEAKAARAAIPRMTLEALKAVRTTAEAAE